MSAGQSPGQPRVAIVGGGLAGLAAAAALISAGGIEVRLFEGRRRLGGRATSFREAEDEAWVDHCQHVSMRCCTNLVHFCQQTGLADAFERHRVLHFFGPDGRHYPFAGSRILPAPLHLGAALWGLKFLTRWERVRIGSALWKLARLRDADLLRDTTVGDWLRRQKQTPQAIERFWELVLQSALGENVDQASLKYARKVFVDGFMANAQAYEVEIPAISLGELYGERLQGWLMAQGVELSLGTRVQRVELEGGRAVGVRYRTSSEGSGGEQFQPCEAVIVAVPWRHVAGLFAALDLEKLPAVRNAGQIESSPISAVHLWFDRPIIDLPHAVLVGRLSQWVFRRTLPAATEHYYQVVISASRQLAGRGKDDIVAEVLADLRAVWPAAAEAVLLKAKVVTDPHAVFSVCPASGERPGIEELRPKQQTPIPNLLLAGDWTATNWPATMEGAVRSGYLAAEGVLKELGRPRRCLQGDLPRGWLARILW